MTPLTKEELHRVLNTVPEPALGFLRKVLTKEGTCQPDPMKEIMVIMSLSDLLVTCAGRLEQRLLKETDLSLEAVTAKLKDRNFTVPTKEEMELITPMLELVCCSVETEAEVNEVIDQCAHLAFDVYLTALDVWVNELLKLACENETVN